jgi:hypothetical protein
MVLTTGLNEKVTRVGLKKVWGEVVARHTPEFSQIFKEESSDQGYEEYQEITGLGLIPEKSETGIITYDDILNGYVTKLVNVSFAGGFAVTREMRDDAKYRIIQDLTVALSSSVILTVESVGANILNRAFSGSYVFGDGKELCATDHPLPGGGTLRNELSTAADLATTSFRQARIDLEKMPDSRGNKMAIMPRKLIVPVDERDTAEIILGTDREPETPNNAINVDKGILPEGFATNHFLTDEDAWFILTNQDGLIFQKRVWPAEFDQDNDSNTLNWLYYTYFRLVFGCYNPRAIFGTPGAA